MTDSPENIQDGDRPAEAAPEGVARAAAGTTLRRWRRAWHAVLWTLASLTVLLLAAPWLLYIPAVQTYVKDKVVAWLNNGSESLQYQVGSIRLEFPLRLKVEDVMAIRDGRDTLFSFGLLETGLDDIPIGQRFFVVRHVGIEDVRFRLPDLTETLTLYGDIPSLDVNDISIDPGGELQVGDVTVPRPRVYVAVRPSEPDSVREPAAPWYIGVRRLHVTDAQVGLNLDTLELPRTLFDYNHLWLDSLRLDASDFALNTGTMYIRGDVDRLSVIERRSGTQIDDLRARFTMNGTEIGVQDLVLRMPETDLTGSVMLDTRYFTPPHRGGLRLDLAGRLGAADVRRQAGPYLPQMTAAWPDAALTLAVQADAARDSLRRLDVRLAMDGRLDVTLHADGTQPWDDSLRAVRADVAGTLADADFLLTAFVAPPAQRAYRLPQGLDVSVTASQQRERLSATARIDRRRRRIAEAETSFNTADESYQARAALRRLDVSAFVPSVPVSGLTARMQAAGRRFDLQDSRARLEASVRLDTMRWQGDSLVNIDAEASLARNLYTLTFGSDHPYVGLQARVAGLYRRDSVTAAGALAVRRLDVGHLPVMSSDLGTFAFRADFDAAYDWKDYAHLRLEVDSLLYTDAAEVDADRHAVGKAGRQTHLDGVSVTFRSAPSGLFAHLKGGDADVMLDVDRSVAALPGVLDTTMRELDRQLAAMSIDVDALQRTLPRGTLRLDMESDNPFYPFIHYYGYGFTTAHVRLTNAERLSLRAHIDDLYSGAVGLDTLSAELTPLAREGYGYAVHAVYNDPKPKTSFTATAAGQLLADSLTARLDYVNGRGIRLYDFGASLALASDTLTLRLAPDPVIYAQPFTVNADNYIRVTSFRDVAERSVGTTALVEMRGPQGLELTLRTTPVPRRRGNGLLLSLRHLDLDYVRRTAQWDHDAGGLLDLTLTALAIPDSLSGQVSLDAGRLHVGEWSADTLRLTGRFAQVVTNRPAAPADGTAPPHRPEGWTPRFLRTAAARLDIDTMPTLALSYRQQDSLRLTARMDGVPLALAGIFMPPEMPLSGTVGGRVSLAGASPDEAVLDAAVALHGASIAYTDAGATFRFPEDTLRLADNRLRLDGYALHAAGGGPLVLSGFVDLSRDFSNPTLSLALKGQNVMLIRNERTSAAHRQSIYGRLPIDADVRVAGALSALRVTGSVTARSGTDLVYYLPDDPLQSSSRTDQLVEFVRFAQLDRKPAKLVLGSGAATAGGVSVDLRLSVAADAKVLVYLSADEKDKAAVTGGGQLRFGSDSDGNLSLNGTYEVQGGDIEINLLPGSPIAVTKAFELEAGSTVAFSGPVDQPELNLTASQEVRCTINDIATGTRAVKFTVYAYLRGTLEDLSVEFSCAAPEDAAMQMQLSSLTAEELTRQAMNLLITQTYTGPGVTGSAGSAAANSVLNQYLQKGVESLMSQKMKHTQISVGIDSYDATGSGNTRTDYSVKISQGFFNDRMRVVVGGRLSSGGDEALGEQDNAVINDVSVEWILKRDGSHYVRLFRKTNYESVLEGEVVEMGVGYVLRREAFQFRSLFLLSDEKRRRQLLERIRLLEEARTDGERETGKK